MPPWRTQIPCKGQPLPPGNTSVTWGPQLLPQGHQLRSLMTGILEKPPTILGTPKATLETILPTLGTLHCHSGDTNCNPGDLHGHPRDTSCHPRVPYHPTGSLGTLFSLGDLVFLDLGLQPPPRGPTAISGTLHHLVGFGTTSEISCHLRDLGSPSGSFMPIPVTPCSMWVSHADSGDPVPTLTLPVPPSPWPPGPGSYCAAAPGSHPVPGFAPRSVS